MKLLEHFKAMQGMAIRYLMPDGYVGRNGTLYVNDDQAARAFALDMIYMLDGPEQRAAQAEAGGLFNKNGWHLPSVNEGLRIARVCNGHPLKGDLPDDEVVVRFKLKPGVTRFEFKEALLSLITEEGLSILEEQVAEAEVDNVVHLNV